MVAKTSEGLWSQQQKEVIFTLKYTANSTPNNYPTDPLMLIKTNYVYAEQGYWVDVGGRTELQQPDDQGDAREPKISPLRSI